MKKKLTVEAVNKEAGKTAKSWKVTLRDEFELEVKAYLPLEQKRTAAKIIAYQSLIQDDSKFYSVDSGLKEMARTLILISSYTDLDFEIDEEGTGTVELFNSLKSSGLDKEIIGALPKVEVEEVDALVENYIANEKEKQEFTFSVGNVFEEIIELQANNEFSELLTDLGNDEDYELALADMKAVRVNSEKAKTEEGQAEEKQATSPITDEKKNEFAEKMNNIYKK